jgi:aspartyl-tRNA(Asn)/glutamyl-tRNA(Gln) amidotransferase subunit A
MQPTNAVERVQRCLDAMRLWNGDVNALITIDAAGAMAAAEAVDHAASEGRSPGLLHGVPMVIKDNIDTAGVRTTYGSGFFRDHVPAKDAFVVERLRQAGAIIVGKANLHEFAFGIRSTNPVAGQCRNPWDTSRIPGGSSGGSAVAIATGMAEMALGTDTAASVRIPAALTGVSGLRPTSGRVSNRGCFPVSPSHDVVGPMARRVEDIARILSVIAGYDHDDAASEQRSVPDFLSSLHDGIAGVRIGRPTSYYYEGLDDDVRSALDEAAETFSRLGAKVVDVHVPGVDEVREPFSVMLLCDACHVHADRIAVESDGWSPQTLERMRLGLRHSGVDYARALGHRDRWARTLQDVFQEVDLLLSPTSPIVAPAIEDSRNLDELTRALARNNIPGAYGRIPGLSIPCGASAAGLPIGLQLEAARWNDALVLRAGVAYQSVTDWHRRVPPLRSPRPS